MSSPRDRRPLDVDSTQRMRALEPSELYDSQRPKWYAIQLVVSDRPVNLDTMPRLEVFAAHRLYAIAAKQQHGTWHALRLGFFADESSAQVICNYLQTFFASPSVVRVSAAEQARFIPKPTAQARPVQKSATVPAPVAPVAPRKAQPPPKARSSQIPGRKTKTLAEQLLDEAREVQLARSGRRPAEQSTSWLGRLFGGPKPRPRST